MNQHAMPCECATASEHAARAAFEERCRNHAPEMLALLRERQALLLEISKAVVRDFPLLAEVQTAFAEARALIAKIDGGNP